MREIAIESARGRFGGLGNGNVGAPPLLALHGWLDNAASFLPMAPLLTHYDLVALDMPGHGRSFHYSRDAEYTPFTAILDVLAAADALGWERFTLLGHSMGGAISTLIATAAPQRIERLLLIEALGPLSGDESETALRLREALAARRALDNKRKRVFDDPELAVQARMQASITELDESSARLLIGRGLREVEGGYEWSSDTRLTLPTAVRLTETQIHNCLRAIACPVRMVVADPAPPYFPPQRRDARIACVGEIRCDVLPGSHHLHMTHPREVAMALELSR